MINQLLEMVLIAFTKDKLKSKWQTHNNPQPAQYLTRIAIITRADSRRASVRSKFQRLFAPFIYLDLEGNNCLFFSLPKSLSTKINVKWKASPFSNYLCL